MKKLSKKIFKFSVQTLTIILVLFCLASNLALAQGGNNLLINTDSQGNPIPADPTQAGGDTAPNNPNTVTITPNNAEDYEAGYQLLAPLPGLEDGFDSTQTCAFTKYLDIIINLLIGICAVLSVIMIVVGGIEYMTSELVSSKEHGKSQISQAVLGLVIALGAWLLLNQLNPRLLNLCLDKSLIQVTPVLQDEHEEYLAEVEPEGTAPTGAKVAGCPGEIISVVTSGGKLTGCSTIMNSVKAMINKAWAENPPIKLSGSGFRTRQRQIELRIQNCGCSPTDNHCIFKKKSTQCNPHTAQPGTSRHEIGFAFDLKCDGTRIAKPDNICFRWLKNNAPGFRLKNYQPEPWHWSVDGGS